MPRIARTLAKGNAYSCEMDDNHHDTGTNKKTSKERNDEMSRVCTADSREICRTCRLRVVEAKERGIECYVCNRWSHAKREMITKEEFNVLGKKNSSFRWMCETCRDQDIGTKIERLLMTVVEVKKEITQMKEQLLETVERSLMEKVDELMTKTCQRMKEEINELKDTTEDIKNEVIRMKKTQIDMRNNVPEEIKKSEERTEKRMVELIKEIRGTEGKQLEEVKMEFINEGLEEIWKETEIRMFEKIDARIEQMEKVQRKKNVVVYNLPESEEEQARDRYKEDEVACRKIFEAMEMENVEQKQLIRLGKREEYKIRPVLVKLKDEKAAKEVLVRAKRLRFSEQYAGVFISKDLSRAERGREKNLRTKELRENETEEEWYKIKKWENSKRKERKKERTKWKLERL